MARRAAADARLPLAYERADVDTPVPPSPKFDLIVNRAAGHHVMCDRPRLPGAVHGPSRRRLLRLAGLRRTTPEPVRARGLGTGVGGESASPGLAASGSQISSARGDAGGESHGGRALRAGRRDVPPLLRSRANSLRSEGRSPTPYSPATPGCSRRSTGVPDPCGSTASSKLTTSSWRCIPAHPCSCTSRASPKKSVLHETEQLSAWESEEVDREQRAAANGGRYYHQGALATALGILASEEEENAELRASADARAVGDNAAAVERPVLGDQSDLRRRSAAASESPPRCFLPRATNAQSTQPAIGLKDSQVPQGLIDPIAIRLGGEGA